MRALGPTVIHTPADCFGMANVDGQLTTKIADAHWWGEDIDRAFTLSRHALLVALWYEATHGDYTTRWADWAHTVHPYLSGLRHIEEAEYLLLTLPPVKDEPPTIELDATRFERYTQQRGAAWNAPGRAPSS